MYESLAAARGGRGFHLYIYAFDEDARIALESLRLANATVVPMTEFEDADLLRVKPGRTAAEYCWTCTPSIILHAIERFGLDHCTYLDADLYFFSDPSVLFGELRGGSIMITRHRYTPYYDLSAVSGIYCVQFVYFRNDARGMKALRWWREACIDWCYARTEDGKFGDQKYLDDWSSRFEGVCDLQNHGGGAAPWNVQRYDVLERAGRPCLRERGSGSEYGLVFYHFHSLRFFDGGRVSLGAHSISNNVKRSIYRPYIAHLERIADRLAAAGIGFDPHGASKFGIRDHISLVKNTLLKNSELPMNLFNLFNWYKNLLDVARASR